MRFWKSTLRASCWSERRSSPSAPGKASMVDTFCYFDKGELWVRGVNIAEYAWGTCNNHVPRRDRKLLLNRPRTGQVAARFAGQGPDDRGPAAVPERARPGEGRRGAGPRPQVVRQARIPQGERRPARDGQGDEKLPVMIKAIFSGRRRNADQLQDPPRCPLRRSRRCVRPMRAACSCSSPRGARRPIWTALEAIPYDGVAALNGADCLMRDGARRGPASDSARRLREVARLVGRSWIFRSGWS